MLDQITPIILTYNEEANLHRTLEQLIWATKILVIDSSSTDNTLAICSEFDNVNVVNRSFDCFANQSNFALSQAGNTEWVLSIDADYIVTPELILEMQALNPEADINGYQIEFQYLINGKPLSGSLYPARTALYRKVHARYVQDGHAHRVNVHGKVSKLNAKIQHDDRKSFGRWLQSQRNYAQEESKKLRLTPWAKLSNVDKLRKLSLAPFVIFPYTLIIKGVIVDGWPGILYASQRLIAEVYLQIARVKYLFH